MGTTERRRREKDRRRAEILDAAERVFFARGYAGTTVEQIAEAAQLSKGTIYLYFDSKEALYTGIVMRGVGILAGLFREAYASRVTGIEKVRAIGEAYLRFFREHEDYFDALLRYEARQTEAFHDDDPLRVLIDAIRTGIEDGTLRDDLDPEATAVLLWGQTTGVFQIAFRKCEAIGEEYGIGCDRILEYYFRQTWRMLSSGREPAGDEGGV